MCPYLQILLLAAITLLSPTLQQVTLVGPEMIDYEIRQTEDGKIRYKLGNFGNIPYGTTILGKVFYSPNNDGTNYWCEEDQTYNDPEIMVLKDNEYVPIIFVDHSTSCSYAHKAANVQNRQGKMMLIASDSNILDDEYNIDDPLENVHIPTIIIPKDIGDIFREYLKSNTTRELGKITLSIKFSGILNEDGKVEMELFFRSDDLKGLNFFNDFNYYRQILGPQLKFTPYYKYSTFVNEKTNNDIESENEEPCVKKEKFCASSNNDLQISTGRLVLLENIRQSCIYQRFTLDKYWEYMMKFTELCTDTNAPLFNGRCSKSVMKKIGIDDQLEEINSCMTILIENNGKIENDYRTFSKRKIYSIPELYINGVPYRGSWYSKNIFQGICDGFLEDKSKCDELNAANIVKQESISSSLVMIIIFLIIAILVCSLLCYKRFINKNLEEGLNDRIQEQAMRTISKYNVFKESTSGSHKLEMA